MNWNDVKWQKSDASVPLDALVRRMSRMAENAFCADTPLPILWLVEGPKGQLKLATPIPFDDDAPDDVLFAYKDGLAESLRRFFRDNGVIRVVHAAECWTLPKGGDHPGGSIRHHPDRQEIIHIDADDGLDHLIATREIHRPPRGKAQLSKLEIHRVDRVGRPPARFEDMLPIQGTNLSTTPH